jgi:hypothetical protein
MIRGSFGKRRMLWLKLCKSLHIVRVAGQTLTPLIMVVSCWKLSISGQFPFHARRSWVPVGRLLNINLKGNTVIRKCTPL